MEGAFFWENLQKKTRKIRKRIIYHDNGSPQTDPHGEHMKKKQYKLRMNIRNVCISVWNTNVFRIEYTPYNSKIDI